MNKKDHSVKLKRQLGLFDSSMMVIGIVIGSGIFMTTGLMADALPSASLILLAWTLGGLQMLAGALTYAELGAAMPKAGGQYVYLREAYGPLPGFLFGWVAFVAYISGTNAAIAVAIAEHLGSFYPSLSTHNSIIGIGSFSISGGQIFALSLIHDFIYNKLFRYCIWKVDPKYFYGFENWEHTAVCPGWFIYLYR